MESNVSWSQVNILETLSIKHQYIYIYILLSLERPYIDKLPTLERHLI